ncbi:MAG TPA: hypothetical protein VHT68_19445 [Pseudolabrys sp.]|nr:hypothetical protein [Pseudolabrys sp.]
MWPERFKTSSLHPGMRQEIGELPLISGANRDGAIAFLHGFMLGKSGTAKFNVDVLKKQSDDFIERCLANPDEKAVDAMSKMKS